jgi:hypothetical protein
VVKPSDAKAVDAKMAVWWATRGVHVETLTYRQWFLALRDLRAEMVAADLSHNLAEVRLLRTLPDTLSSVDVWARVAQLKADGNPDAEAAFTWLGRQAKRWAV